jgi:hypothetical protein
MPWKKIEKTANTLVYDYEESKLEPNSSKVKTVKIFQKNDGSVALEVIFLKPEDIEVFLARLPSSSPSYFLEHKVDYEEHILTIGNVVSLSHLENLTKKQTATFLYTLSRFVEAAGNQYPAEELKSFTEEMKLQFRINEVKEIYSRGDFAAALQLALDYEVKYFPNIVYHLGNICYAAQDGVHTLEAYALVGDKQLLLEIAHKFFIEKGCENFFANERDKLKCALQYAIKCENNPLIQSIFVVLCQASGATINAQLQYGQLVATADSLFEQKSLIERQQLEIQELKGGAKPLLPRRQSPHIESSVFAGGLTLLTEEEAASSSNNVRRSGARKF